ncbi:MAG TPA: glycoside hydrolase family 9 protein, partial [Spirochaetota bacterium]
AGNIANCGVLQLYSYRFSGEMKYLKAAGELLDFVLGRNSMSATFITGIGKKSPHHPHHRASASDMWDDPVPGLVVGGPNQNMDDSKDGMKYPDTHQAKCYLDQQGSYSSNEPAINQNAPVVFLMGAISKELGSL